MRLKAAHWWLSDGTIVVEVRDHDALMAMHDPVLNPYARRTLFAQYNRKPQIATVVSRLTVPKGTSKAEIKLTKKALSMAHEIKVNEVSR